MLNTRYLISGGVAAALLGTAGCADRLGGPGTCPEYCPVGSITVVDTLLLAHVAQDSTFRSYVDRKDASAMYVTTDDVGPLVSRGVIRFARFPLGFVENFFEVPVVELDSFRITLPLLRRGPVADLELLVFRLPATMDGTETFEELDPFFADSTLIAAIAVDDTLASGRFGAMVLPDVFPTLEDDSLQFVIGVGLRAANSTFASLGTREHGNMAEITRYVTIDSAGTLVERSDNRTVIADVFVPAQLSGGEPPGVLAVGGSPAARVMLRATIPPHILDTARIVGATLLLVPSEPVVGVIGDSLSVIAHGLASDFGAKSPLVPVPSDSIALRTTRVAAGSTDVVEIDVTDLFRRWQVFEQLPRTIALRVEFGEGGSTAELRFHSSEHPTLGPVVRIAYVPRVDFNR